MEEEEEEEERGWSLPAISRLDILDWRRKFEDSRPSNTHSSPSGGAIWPNKFFLFPYHYLNERPRVTFPLSPFSLPLSSSSQWLSGSAYIRYIWPTKPTGRTVWSLLPQAHLPSGRFHSEPVDQGEERERKRGERERERGGDRGREAQTGNRSAAKSSITTRIDFTLTF